jgi:hypothetical protein
MTRIAAAVFVWVLLSLPALAWDGFGHMEVAEIAWKGLDAPVRDKAAALLKLNPNYDDWTKDLPAEIARRDRVPSRVDMARLHSQRTRVSVRRPREWQPSASRTRSFAKHRLCRPADA